MLLTHGSGISEVNFICLARESFKSLISGAWCLSLFMDRWIGVLKVPLCLNSRTYYRVAASLCLSPTSKTLAVSSAHLSIVNH